MPMHDADRRLSALAEQILGDISPVFGGFQAVSHKNTRRVLQSFSRNRVSDTHFAGTTGYGYDDLGRDALDAIFAEVMGCEDALVRLQFVSGTHAISCALIGSLSPGDVLLSAVGTPYDTLSSVVGLGAAAPAGSLKSIGVSFAQVDTTRSGDPDWEGIRDALSATRPAAVFVQRSRGYSSRRALSIDDIHRISGMIKTGCPGAVLIVDNCYGEFVEPEEPGAAGADLVAGSLIKNPGGGLAPTGGYIAGRRDLVEAAAARLTAPGIGRHCGATLGQNRLFFQGLFLAPHTVSQALMTAAFGAALMEKLGYPTDPGPHSKRGDIIQRISFGAPGPLLSFCRGLQFGAPVDSFAVPEPWDMPGYDCPVVMAAGAFVQGSSIELSCDAPIRPPFDAFLQGGLTFESGMYGLLSAARALLENGDPP